MAAPAVVSADSQGTTDVKLLAAHRTSDVPARLRVNLLITFRPLAAASIDARSTEQARGKRRCAERERRRTDRADAQPLMRACLAPLCRKRAWL